MTTAERIAPYTLRRLIEENEALRAQAARLSHWESAIGAVMMPDLKDWHDNDPKEWPDVAAAVIRTLREQRDEEVELSGRLSAENEALRAQVEALQKAAEHLPWIGHGADWTEAKPVYLVATGEVNEGQETYTRHDAPVPLADQEVLFTRPPEPLVRPAVTRDQIREVFMRCGFTIKEGQTDLKQYVYDAAYALLASAPQPPVEVGDWQDTLYLLRRLISNQHTFTGPEFRAELTKIVGEVVAAAPQPEAQKGGA